jgi:hypothetical protein
MDFYAAPTIHETIAWIILDVIRQIEFALVLMMPVSG